MSRRSQRRSRQTRSVGWRRIGAHLALIGLVFEVLIGLGHAGLLSGTTAAADDVPLGYMEICTPTGIKQIAWDGVPPSEEPDSPSEPQNAKSPCIVCAALGACAVACLDAEIDVDWRLGVTHALPQDREATRPSRACQPKQSRAPPLSV